MEATTILTRGGVALGVNGKPIAGAVVRAMERQATSAVTLQQAETDEQGYYLIEAIPATRSTGEPNLSVAVAASMPGHLTVRREPVFLVAGAAFPLDFKLPLGTDPLDQQPPGPVGSTPDLVVSGVLFDPPTVMAGGTVTISVSLTNAGGSASGRISLQFSLGRPGAQADALVSVTTQVTPLSPGEQRVMTAKLKADVPASDYIVHAEVDPDGTAGQRPEHRANDRTAAPTRLIVNAAPLATPDLSIRDVSVDVQPVVAGTGTHVRFTVVNIGQSPSMSSMAAVRIGLDGSSQPDQNDIATVSLPSLPAGGTHSAVVLVKAPSNPGSYSVWIVADVGSSAGQPADARLNDNMVATTSLRVARRTAGGPASAEGVYGGRVGRSASSAIRVLVLDTQEIWALYGQTVAGEFYVTGFVQGQGQASNGKITSTDLKDFGTLPAMPVTLSAVFDSAVGTLGGQVGIRGQSEALDTGPISDIAYQFERPASLDAIAGTWQLSTNTGDVLNLTIDPAGELKGLSALGCSLSGRTATHPSGRNLFTVQLAFGGSPCLLPGQSMLGLAILHVRVDGRSQLTFAGVTRTRTAGLAAAGTR